MNQENGEEKVYKQATERRGRFEFKVEGLKDGYRFTVRGDEEKLKEQRRVGAAFVNFLRQSERAGWWIPWPFRLLLRFWSRYK
ncbi:hypothetical protein AM501_24400 [Aneurinibacillus migulanus]|jgi:hypothetical protein|uniref:Uncharacterized protein n=1 Tax=Aneurinibacillus migulanus TaxID=47500 RepID=A0A0D1XYK3_ANEMI|nr:hypothetical protein [Aneurinibacillus migulanus]KIV52102.1 hypothetical protein TS65_26765 [Aneurinibacillus migulanus]KIV54208.1 hypothetical protein TS64_13885 [Aneurinibacillus migulanus]KON98244.1 hypothetical protein AF333_25245 [Aneurinibacillus migulanus]KPD05765.1 hypothetical protein AM501_24400 [Aneurinibacillus migulanus]MCP1354457.1 hypothetical protein [Aneurinibacillus migulanus]